MSDMVLTEESRSKMIEDFMLLAKCFYLDGADDAIAGANVEQAFEGQSDMVRGVIEKIINRALGNSIETTPNSE